MKEYDEKQLEILVIKSQKGDSEAFGELYDIFVTPIYRYIFFKVKKTEVEDLTEILFLKVWENINKYKKQKNKSFKAWIFRIAHNLVVDHYKMNREHVSLDPRISDTKRDHNPLETADEVLNKENLKLAIGKLKKNYQQVILLKFINELKNDEICKIMKKSEGSVRILQFRALKALRQIMNDMGIKNLE